MRIPVVALGAGERLPLRVLRVAGIVVEGSKELTPRLLERDHRPFERGPRVETSAAFDDGNINSETVLVSGEARRSSARATRPEDVVQVLLSSRITATAVQIDDDAISARASETLHNHWSKGIVQPREDGA